MITSSDVDLGRASARPAVVEAELSHYRKAIGVTGVVTLGFAGLTGFLLYFLSTTPSQHASLYGWWAWFQAAGRQWDPTSTLALLSGITLPLIIATVVSRVVQQPRVRQSAAHAPSPDTVDDTAIVMTLESITITACLAAATTSWMLVPVALNAPAAAALRTLAPVLLGLAFSALAAVSRPSDAVREHYHQRAQHNRERLSKLCTHLERHLAELTNDLPPGPARPRRSTSAVRVWGWLAAIGAIYGASVGGALAIESLATSRHESWWHLCIVTVLSAAYNGVLVPGFVTMRASAANQRLLRGRWSNAPLTLALLGLALYVLAGSVTIAVTGRWVLAAAIGLTGFGPALIFSTVRRSRHAAALQLRDAHRRLRTGTSSAPEPARTTRPQPTPRAAASPATPGPNVRSEPA